MKGLYLAAAVATMCIASAASAQTVTPAALDGWSAANVQGTGSVAITSAYSPSGQQGSLQFSTSGAGDKADYVKSWGIDPTRTLGSITSFSYSFFRDSSSTSGAHLTPAVRLNYYDVATSQYGYLIYEPTYNGFGSSVPTDAFVDVDLLNANFWMRQLAPGNTIESYSITLANWASGTLQAAGADILSANTLITGIQVGVGSGWNGSFVGAADNILLRFGANDTVAANFEPNLVAPVPEPATWAMMIVGFGAAGFAMRRRAKRTTTAYA